MRDAIVVVIIVVVIALRAVCAQGHSLRARVWIEVLVSSCIRAKSSLWLGLFVKNCRRRAGSRCVAGALLPISRNNQGCR